MNARTPLEACIQIAREHATNTIAAIEQERAAQLAGELEQYGKTLSKLAGKHGEQAVHGSPPPRSRS